MKYLKGKNMYLRKILDSAKLWNFIKRKIIHDFYKTADLFEIIKKIIQI